ncbi:MAG TPA: hypothetical protein VMA83_10200 [Solirubrobacteraceae bacterium]|nr:hypothetical protein [Solirubrobacteraceae bacterium]
MSAPESRSSVPSWLRPRESEPPHSGVRRRRIENWLMLALGVVLIAITINDTARQTIINKRLVADLATWSHYTHLDSEEPSLEQALWGYTNSTDVVCGNLLPHKKPGTTVQQCTVIVGPVHHGLRTVIGGWRLPPKHPDHKNNRYDCFGTANPMVHEKCEK